MNNPKCFVSKVMEINTISKRKSPRINNIKIYTKKNPINKKFIFNDINSKNNEKKLPKLLKVFSTNNLKKCLPFFIIIIFLI